MLSAVGTGLSYITDGPWRAGTAVRVANVVDLTKSLLVDNQDHAARFKVRA